ncbi:MAG TPA: ABC transporter substrate-binding protein [Methanoregulaceae archaeon]|nr:ABC transporter substrate-binding protein [Methanoregulaceae archaeon]
MNVRSSYLIFLACLIVIIAVLFLALYSPPGSGQAGTNGDVCLVYTSTGSMAQLLDSGQIDAFIVWESVVSTATMSGSGKMIANTTAIPPPGEWSDAACCVFVLRNDTIAQYPDVAALLSGLTTAAVDRVNEDPSLAENITARWVYGTKPILTMNGSLEPDAVEEHAFGNINFTSDVNPPVITNIAVEKDGTVTTSTVAFSMNPTVAAKGRQFLNKTLPLPAIDNVPTISLGYLPTSDHTAPLYVMVEDSDYFCEQYGFCLVPDNAQQSRPDQCTLLVNGSPAAHVDLVPGSSGGGIMTTVGQKALDGAYIGSVPVELQINLGNPSSMIQSINSGGTGLVVSDRAPCNDWTSFVGWAKTRSKEGKPLIIATVQSSIQEEMIRNAMSYENISVIMYGA